jgi:uncharacterized C2H2 Zn-finger protein
MIRQQRAFHLQARSCLQSPTSTSARQAPPIVSTAIVSVDLLTNMANPRRRSSSFSQARTTLSTEICDPDNHNFIPRRSPTSPEDLQALLGQHPSTRHIVAQLMAFDEKFTSVPAPGSAKASTLADPEVLPWAAQHSTSSTRDDSPMEVESKPVAECNPHEHASDSGLGSSMGSSKYGKDSLQLPVSDALPSDIHIDDVRAQQSSLRESITASIASAHAVTQSFSASGASEEKHTLSEHACKQIHEFIVQPILAEEALKDFHPLIRDVPRRIGAKSICNLRDLEKTLIFLAPVSGIRYLSEDARTKCISLGFKELSTTAKSYERFCKQSLHLLMTTVENLSERDQRLPSDRPYTNNYFLDLFEQIRRYAQIMAATREKEANGEDLDEMDYSRYDCHAAFLFTRTNTLTNSDEKMTLRGGRSHNGRPLELVRERNGKVMPISGKRALSDDELDEDDATRSMARRRKSEKPGDVTHNCPDCPKTFKRPCDLTKHEKTHSRPWKCSEIECKYHITGWPTEKERARHFNDKHSDNPEEWPCLFPPCVYVGRREHNLKSHMEGAHGWEYIRSKGNGKRGPPKSTKKAKSAKSGSPSTPLTPYHGTPMSAPMSTPVTPFAPSPQVPMVDTFGDYYAFGTPALSVQGFQDDFRRDSATTDGSHYTYSSGHSPMEPTSFDDAVTPEDSKFNHNDVLSNCGLGANFNTGFHQQPTPALSVDYSFEPFTNNTMANGITQISPLGQPDVTLFSPHMPMDEGYGDLDLDLHDFSRPMEDFTLFDTAQPSMTMSNTLNFFPDVNSVGMGSQFDLYSDPSALDDPMGNNFYPQ